MQIFYLKSLADEANIEVTGSTLIVMSSNVENYDIIDDHRNSENFQDDDSWGSDFDDISSTYSREIEDNIINEDLEENTHGNVMNSAGSSILKTAVPSVRTNDISTISSSRIYHKHPCSQGTPNVCSTPGQKRMANTASSHSLTASNIVTETVSIRSEGDIRTGNTNEKHIFNQNSEINQGNKIPGKLKPEAFSFLKSIPRAKSANDDGSQDKERKHHVATAFVHAVKLEQQNSDQNSAVDISAEKYEWTNPKPSAPPSSFSSDTFGEEHLRIGSLLCHSTHEMGDLKNVRNFPKSTNIKPRETPEVAKPPLPSRPPPIFTSSAGKNASTSMTSNKARFQTPTGKSKKPTPTAISSSFQIGHMKVSTGKLTKGVEEKSLEDRLKMAFRPIPPPTSIYPIIDESLSCNEMTATSPEISLPLPLPKTKPKQVLHTQLAKDVKKQCSVNNSGISSQTEVQRNPAIKAHFGDDFHECNNPLFSVKLKNVWDHPHQFQTKEDRAAMEFNIAKSRRSLSSNMEFSQPEAHLACSKSDIPQAVGFQRKPEQPKPISVLDEENWPNYLNRPQLPQKLKQTQRSLSCTSLVQSFKEMSFPKWNQPEKARKDFESAPPPRVTAEASKPAEHQNREINVKDITRSAWFHDINAMEAQTRLLKMHQDGAFLIRYSSKPTTEIPYTMCVAVGGRILNSHIRLKCNGEYALGKEKRGEKTFSTIPDLIRYHQEVPIEIHPTGSGTLFHVCLLVTPPK